MYIVGEQECDRDGNVGDIGGIDKKVVAASSGSQHLAPNPVTEEAKQIPNARTAMKQP